MTVESPALVYDLGCGTGNITRVMAERWPRATIVGVDQSAEMLSEARSQCSDIEWVQTGIETWTPDRAPDLIYANAALHWLGRHDTLLTRLVAVLGDGGCIAIQMPLSWDLPSHRLMRETLKDCRGRALGSAAWRKKVSQRCVEEPAFYRKLLARQMGHVDVWETEYQQVLKGEDAVFEWVRSTGLKPFLDGLAGDERENFFDEYKKRLREAYPANEMGDTLYPFRRLFIVATK